MQGVGDEGSFGCCDSWPFSDTEDPERRPATLLGASLGKNDCDFMKFGGTETGTQGTLRHQLLYFPSKTTDRTSKASNSLNKYIKNTQHSFKLLEDSMSTRKQTTNFLKRRPCKLDSQLDPTFSSQKDSVSIRLTLFSLYKHWERRLSRQGGNGSLWRVGRHCVTQFSPMS